MPLLPASKPSLLGGCDCFLLCLQAIGSHGAAALMAEAKARGRGGTGKLNVLTHCNTGSLATSGYGTALGVIRALHEQVHGDESQHWLCCPERGCGVALGPQSNCVQPLCSAHELLRLYALWKDN